MPIVDVRQKQEQEVAAPATSAASDYLQDPLSDELLATGSAETVSKASKKKTAERGKGGTEAGAQAWSGAMGEFIGGKLYEAIAGQVSEAKLEGIAVSIVESGVGAFQKWLREQTTTPDAAAATAMLAAELKKLLGPKAKELMDSEGGGWAAKVGTFTDDNPWIIASAALAAAVTYVVTNQKIPSLKAPISLGGAGKVTVGTTLGGGIMDLFKGDVFLKEMTGSYASKGGAVKLDVKHKSDGDGAVNQSATLALTDEEKYAKLYGERKMADGDMTSGKVGMEVGKKNDTASSYLRAEHLMGNGDDVTTFGAGGSLTHKKSGIAMSGDVMAGTDGRYNASGKFSKKLNPNLSMSALGSASRMPGSNGMDTKYGGQVGLDYKKNNFSVGGFVGQDVINGKRDTKAGIGLKWSF
ncbi:MAG: hypothetical protein ACJAZO_005249 [Myxococcota bacterium]|jgi:hypothetical protein